MRLVVPLLVIACAAVMPCGAAGTEEPTPPPAPQRPPGARGETDRRIMLLRPGVTGELSVLNLPGDLQKRLDLSPDQRRRLRAIRARKEAEIHQGRGSFEKTLELIQKVTAAAEREALQVLTPEQRKEFGALQEALRDFAGLGRYASALLWVENVTPEQRERVQQVAEQVRDRRSDILREFNASKRHVIGKELFELDQEMLASVRRILTPEQTRQFDTAVARLSRGPGFFFKHRRGPRPQ